MRIECKTTFLDGPDRFEAGDVRTVEDARGHKFLAHGWAAEVGAALAPVTAGATTDLAINNAQVGTKDSNG